MTTSDSACAPRGARTEGIYPPPAPTELDSPRPRVSLPVITTSEVRSFLRCRREHHFRYGLRVRPLVAAPALRFGTLVHLGLEAMWRAWGDGIGGEDALAAALTAVQSEADAFDRVRAEELLIAYFVRWKHEAYEVLGVEVPFRASIVNPTSGARSRTFELGGKIDAIVRELGTGRVLIVEHKTTSEDVTLGGVYWRRLRLDHQVSNYLAGARAMGFDAVGCVYDVLCKSSLKPYKATPEADRRYVIDKQTKERRLDARQRERDETPEEFRARIRDAISREPDGYFARGEVVRSEDDERDAAYDVWNVAREMRDAERAQRFPRNPHACLSPFGLACDFYDVCTHTASLDDPTRFRVAETTHEELAHPAPLA
jgi:hypothetical protein